MHSASIYLGLLIYCGYVLFDTQLILEKRKLTNLDHFAVDALSLLIGIFNFILQKYIFHKILTVDFFQRFCWDVYSYFDHLEQKE